MIKKLATAAIASLSAFALAAGSATAQPTPDDVGIAQQADAVLNEVGVDLDTLGTVMELKNTTESSAELDGFGVFGCDTLGSTQLVAFGPDDQIPAGEFFFIADNNYAGSIIPDLQTDLSFLSSASHQGIYLSSGFSVVNGVFWGGTTAPIGCPFGLDPAGNPPTSSESLQLNATPPPAWCLATPTVAAENATC